MIFDHKHSGYRNEMANQLPPVDPIGAPLLCWKRSHSGIN